jgi:hypothetical protein
MDASINEIGKDEDQADENNPFSFKQFLSKTDQFDQLPEFEVVQASNTTSCPTTILPEIIDTSFKSVGKKSEELNEAHVIIEKQQKQIQQLEKQVKHLLKKEENDTNQLEIIIRQVENNLKQTEIRAIESENSCNLLKINILRLKEELKAKNEENEQMRKQIETLNGKLTKVCSNLTIKTKAAKNKLLIMLDEVEELFVDTENIRIFLQSFESSNKIQELIEN